MPSLNASPQGLNQIKQRRKARGWAIEDRYWLIVASQTLDSSTDWTAEKFAEKGIFAPGISLSTWKRFLRGEPINAKVFKAFCQMLELDWQAVTSQEVKEPAARTKLQDSEELQHLGENAVGFYQDWGESPDVSLFYGRANELSVLEQWVVYDRCRLVAVLGMGGIGKTTLLAELAQRIVKEQRSPDKSPASPFQYIIWRSLLNAPPIDVVLLEWIRFLSNQQETQLPERLDAQLARLRHYLQTRRCLLVLDNFETVLTGGTFTGHYREGYEAYGQLLDQVGKVTHQSCLLLTSREKPQEIVKNEGKARPVRSLNLSGLGQPEARQIFAELGDFVGSESDWENLIQLYSGNPLGLELVAKHIQQVFDGNIYRFWREGKPIFYDLLELLDRHFKRLSEQEQEIVYWLAIHREPVSLEVIQQDFQCSLSHTDIAGAVQSLQRRWTLERSGDGLTLQPVLMEYVTGQLVRLFVEDIEQLKIGAINQYAVLQAIAKEYIRTAQNRLIVQPVVNCAIADCGSRANLEAQLKQLLAILRASSQPPGYAAGNLLNLLCHLKANLGDYDFSGLPIWQAYLQGTILYDVNFTAAKFAKTMFTQTFGNVLTVFFSPDGSTIATGNADRNIYLWRVEDGQNCLTLRGHTNWVRAVTFSADGKLLVSGSEDQTIKIWDLQNGTCIRTIQGHALNLRSVALSPDGTTIASASDDQTIRLWDLKTGACVRILKGHENWVLCATFSRDGTQIVSGSCDQTIRIWDVATGQCLHVLTGHESWVVPVSFNSKGDRIVSAGFDQTVRLWDAATGKCLQILQGHTGWIWCATFSPDDNLIASTGVDQTIRLWDAETGACLQAIQEHTKQVWAVTFHPNGKWLASCGEDQTIRLWDVTSGRCLRIIKGYANWVRAISFSRDSQMLFSAHQDSTIKCWDVQTHRWLYSLQGHTDSVMAVSVSPHGQYLASAGDDRTVRIWLISEQRCVHVLSGHSSGVWAIAFSPDSRFLVSSGCDCTVRVWDVKSAACLHVMRGHGDRILDLAFLTTTLVASASEDQTVKLWDIVSGECIRTISETTRVMSVACSPNGKIVATGSLDTTIKLWDIESGQLLQTLAGHTGWVLSLAFSPDGQTLTSGGCDQTIKVWQISTGQCVNTLEQHQNWIWSVVCSPNGMMVASASEDETINIWSLQSGQCLATLLARRPYDGMKIAEATGITSAQKSALNILGATESVNPELFQSTFQQNGTKPSINLLDH